MCYSFVVLWKILNPFICSGWAIFCWNGILLGKSHFQFCLELCNGEGSYVETERAVWNLVSGLTTVVARTGHQCFPSICIHFHGYQVTWSQSGLCLDWGRSQRKQRYGWRVEWVGGRGAVSRLKGFIRSSVLVYVPCSFVPCSWSGVKRSSICHSHHCILYLWSKPLLNLTTRTLGSVYPDSATRSRNSSR